MKKTYTLLLLGLLAVLPGMAQQNDGTATTEILDTPQQAEEHVEFLDVSLNDSVQAMLDEMENRGLRLVCIDSVKQICSLTGILSGMEVTVDISCNKELTKINHIKLSTPKARRNQREDFDKVLKWLRKVYDEPDWKGTVRSHRFCRWFVDFDHDIILIATGQGNTEVWFYENHKQRNIDYYSILKYCEKNPCSTVPMTTAMESVTWKRNDSIQVRKHVVSRHSKRAALRKQRLAKRMKARRKPAKSKTKKRRR